MTPEEKALEFANKLEKQTIECPRNCLNPGLYFGYMAGYEAIKIASDLALARKNMEIHELQTEIKKLYAAHSEWTKNDCRTFGMLMIENSELKQRLSRNCPFDCYYEGKHPGCDSDDCDYLGYAFKDVK